GKNIDDWLSPEGDITYIVLDPGPAKNVKSAGRTWTLKAGDTLIVSPNRSVILKYKSGQADRKGAFIYYSAELPCKISFSDGQATSATLTLTTPTVKDDVVTGATQVEFSIGSPSGSDIINDGLVLGRV
ncbi:hypothetical protein, partial [Serratia marcescens]|uniref:hypothetical protein n=1 Tax=Serratia marcescens TaxID=615 RepID=UPI001652EC37